MLVISFIIININFYGFTEALLATSNDWSLNFNLQTLLRSIAFINKWDQLPLKLWWFKYKGAGHIMVFINECIHLSDQDSDTLLYRLLSESALLNMNIEWNVDLLIESQLWHHSWMFSTIFTFVEKRGLKGCWHSSLLEKHDWGQRGGWNVIINDIDWVVTECSNLTHLIGCKYSMK